MYHNASLIRPWSSIEACNTHISFEFYFRTKAIASVTQIQAKNHQLQHVIDQQVSNIDQLREEKQAGNS